ncbi:MAG TPA: META domain-containing protein [Usitatibacter sp.]|nr:META domain-containing protein [Usitatibacter sp.]
MERFRRLAPLALGCLLAACAATPREPPPRPFAGTRWELMLELPSAVRPWVRFGDGRMEGFGGCNRIGARYVQDSVGARAIAIGRIGKGMHACDRSARDAEDRFLEVLQSVSSYSIAGDAMSMTGSAGTVRFRAAGEETKR